MKEGIPNRDLETDIEMLHYLLFSSTNVQTLKIVNADLDPYSPDDKFKYVFFDETIKTKLLVAQSNQSK